MNVTTPVTRRAGLVALTLGIVALATSHHAAKAASYPDPGKPIRIVVGFPPGGGADLLARVIAPGLSEKLHDNVIIDNRPGAGGLLATEYVAKSPADGYTLYIATPGSFTIWPNLKKLNYDPARDFAPISNLVTMPNLLVTAPDVPYKSVQELIAAAKAPGARINYASGGVATIGQIAAEQFKLMAGIQMTHVPYKGTTPAINDVMAGLVPLTFSDPSAKTFVDAGKLRLLAVTTEQRSRLFPDTPTIAEAGIPGYDLMNWYGLVAPSGTPPEAIRRLNAALSEVMAQPDVQKKLAAGGMEATSTTPEAFGQLMARERAKWDALAKKSGMQAE
jgi:tripartite-type tricarboxylate transporter receptor subunit TctC